jgi:hypothetical protein
MGKSNAIRRRHGSGSRFFLPLPPKPLPFGKVKAIPVRLRGEKSLQRVTGDVIAFRTQRIKPGGAFLPWLSIARGRS